MTTLRKGIRFTVWLGLLLTIALGGCWSYISKGAQHKFESREGPFSVTVYPVSVVRGSRLEHDQDLGQKLVTFLREEGLADPVSGTPAVGVPVKWGPNEAKMAQQSASAFAAKVKEAGIQTDYALLAEILCNTDETWVGGVHFYLSDRDGKLASGGLSNSDWEDFKQVKPHDRQGGYEVLTRMLRRDWKRR